MHARARYFFIFSLLLHKKLRREVPSVPSFRIVDVLVLIHKDTKSMTSGKGGEGINEEQRECAQLDIALQRISLLEDSKLEKTLSKLLPMVVAQLSSTYARTKTKTVELLTHVNKRTNGLREIEFPLDGLIEVVLGKSGRENSLVLSLIHISEPTRPY